mmetsp:Transcript_23176/g.35875  ORF Transcript_23176/g.35875 Transcript_23176/m.35875 type:complete len:84 (-) Transcript_23176:705-956(-)
MKKVAAYTTVSLIPQLLPFCLFVAFQVPLPMFTIHIWIHEFASNLFVLTSFANEPKEMNLLRRLPRSTSDYLVNFKLLAFSYL